MQLLLQRVAASSLLMALTRWSVGCCAWPVLAAEERFVAVLATIASVVEADSWTLRQLEFLVERLVDNALLVATEVDASVAVDAMCV